MATVVRVKQIEQSELSDFVLDTLGIASAAALFDEVEDDTSPTLGGNLDANTFTITNVGAYSGTSGTFSTTLTVSGTSNFAAGTFSGDVDIDGGSLTLTSGSSNDISIEGETVLNRSGAGLYTFLPDGVGSNSVTWFESQSPANGIFDVNGSLVLANGATINEFSTDGTMAGNSDSAVPTEQAVVEYIASSGLVFTYPQINDTSQDHQYVFNVSELTADRTVLLPLLTADDEFVFADHTQTLGNKTLNGATLQAVIDASGADSFSLPTDAAPIVNANGEIALDTTVADFSHGVLKYYGGEEMAIISVPVGELTTPTDGHLISYNATNDEFELVAAGAADNLGNHTATQNLVMGDFSITGIDTLVFTDVNGTIAGIQNQNLVDRAANETITGDWDFGGANSLEIPNSATPTVNSNGEIAVDTSFTGLSHGALVYYGGEEMLVVAIPAADTLTGGEVIAYNSTDNEFELTTVAGAGDVTAAAVMTDHSIVRGDGGGKGVQDSGILIDDSDNVSAMGSLGLGGDITLYEAVNDGNPQLRIGSTDAEEAHIQAIYDSGAQTLDYVIFQTDVASATADKGLFRFNVDGTDILDIDDGGLSMAATMGITFADGTSTVAGIQNQNLVDKGGNESITGDWDFGGAGSLEIPNSATPTVNADGEIAVDTSFTDLSHGALLYYGGEEMLVVAIPSGDTLTDGYVVAYNAADDEFELVSNAGGGGDDLGDHTATQDLDMGAFDIQINTGGLIKDAGGDEYLEFVESTTPANYLRITSADAANGPDLSAQGSDANIDLNLTAKGSGEVTLVSSNLDTNSSYVRIHDTYGIIDSSGNELLLFSEQGDTTYIQIENATSGNGPKVTSKGETNVDLNLEANGTGRVIISLSDMELTGGDLYLPSSAVIRDDTSGNAMMGMSYTSAGSYVLLGATTGGGTIDVSGTNKDLTLSADGSGLIKFTSDLERYEATNDGNPQIRLGAADAEEFLIQTVYDSGAQTLDYVHFQTEAASATADKGLFRFSVDETEILDIDDGGLSLASGMEIDIDGQLVEETQRYESVYIDAAAMVPRTTDGATAGSAETTTNDHTYDYMAFDGATTNEGVSFKLAMPDSWDRSTIKAKFYWLPASGASASDGVTIEISAVAVSDDDTIDVAYGTAVHVDDTVTAGTNGDLHVTAATAAVTVGGTPALGDLILFEIQRLQNDAADTMAEDLHLVGCEIQYQTLNSVTAAW